MCDCRESATLLVRARHNLSTSCVVVRSGVLLGDLFGWCAEARSESFDDIEGFLTLEQDAAWTVNWHCLVSNGDVVATLDPSLQSIRPLAHRDRTTIFWNSGIERGDVGGDIADEGDDSDEKDIADKGSYVSSAEYESAEGMGGGHADPYDPH